MKLAVVTSGFLPVPAAKGGAVEALDDYLIQMNEKYAALELEIISIYDPKAQEMAKAFRQSHFTFVKPNPLVLPLDRIIYFLAKNVLKKANHMSYRYILQRLNYIGKVSRILQKNTYDKVMLENHSTLFKVIQKRKNAKKYEGRYYYHIHNEIKSTFGCKKVMLGTKRVIAVSDYINRTLSDFLGGFPKEKMTVLRNCVDTERFSKEDNRALVPQLRRQYGIQDDEKVLLFTGRLTREKGIRELLLAFHMLSDPKVRLVVAGGYFFGSGMQGSFEEELKTLAKQAGDRIVFTGFVPYTQMPALYAMADIAVIPSVWNDPAPLTVIESMVSGLPLITTYSGGIPEYADQEAAILLPRDEHLPERLYQAMQKLLQDDGLRKKMSAAGRAKAQELNLDHYYHNFVEIINDRR